MVLFYLFGHDKTRRGKYFFFLNGGLLVENKGTKWTGFIRWRTGFIRWRTGFIRRKPGLIRWADEASPPADEVSTIGV